MRGRVYHGDHGDTEEFEDEVFRLIDAVFFSVPLCPPWLREQFHHGEGVGQVGQDGVIFVGRGRLRGCGVREAGTEVALSKDPTF